MITTLSPEQEIQLELYSKKWRKIAISTEPANRAEAERGVKLAYECGGLVPPKEIIWCDSPMAMYAKMDDTKTSVQVAINADTDKTAYINLMKVIDIPIWRAIKDLTGREVSRAYQWTVLRKLREQVKVPDGDWRRDFAYKVRLGQHEAHRIAFYDYCRNVLGFTEETKSMVGLILMGQHAGWWMPYEDVCLISERHTTLNFDDEGKLHCDDGLAVGYPDGWGLYARHGSIVPEDLIFYPEKITPEKILEANDIPARIMIEQYGLDNLVGHEQFHKIQVDLTDKQQSQRDDYIEKWKSIRLAVTPTNRQEAEKGVYLAYQNAGLPPPQHIIWYASPKARHSTPLDIELGDSVKKEVQDAVINSVRAIIKTRMRSIAFEEIEIKFFLEMISSVELKVDDLVHKAVYPEYKRPSHSKTDPLLSLGVYDFLYDVFNFKTETEKLRGLWLIEQHAGAWIPYQNVCKMTERHKKIHFDDNGKLYNKDGFAIMYSDGWGVSV